MIKMLNACIRDGSTHLAIFLMHQVDTRACALQTPYSVVDSHTYGGSCWSGGDLLTSLVRAANGGCWRQDGSARLDFIQNMEYKFVELLSCHFIPSPEDVIR
jgi:hypothetical protein